MTNLRSMARGVGSLYPVAGGWSLAPEGGVIQIEERVAVVADLHLGHEWRRARGGDSLTGHTLEETVARLATMLARAEIDRLVVAGDLVESHRPCARTEADVARLRNWLGGRGVELVAVRGNHDPRAARSVDQLEVAGWTVAHGDQTVVAICLIQGHLHPSVRAEGMSFPCFLASSKRIVLPAFSRDAAGWNVAPRLVPSCARERGVVPNSACVAACDDGWVELGWIDLRRD